MSDRVSPYRFDYLKDVSKTAPSDGQVYAYVSATGLLTPTTVSAGGGLTDTIVFIDNSGDTNTVVIVDGLIQSWSQGVAGTGTPIGLLLALTRV